ncbi:MULTISPECIES: hypothetical protein [Dyella]|uniref:DUF1269 domain-containing protein n=2 Tax=Dyella TaxID=231454 RepID=A0A4R0Z3I6_9GAMM|nr:MULTISPECIES: hypothetical protein [Dyella]TBR39495.1 hypothetical protein EYV96_04585 [Dyella terrae]TCI12920.1 hypothetical protein EZM97_06285 [Dyella soli]
MKVRHVYSAPDMGLVKRAMGAARKEGIESRCISLIARHDIELESIPDQRRVVTNDFYPAAARGVVGGGASGLLVGLVAIVIPPLGLTLAGVGAMTLIGATMGAWASALAGASLPDPVRRKFEHEIEQGSILVVLDGKREVMPHVDLVMHDLGLVRLPFEQPTMLT